MKPVSKYLYAKGNRETIARFFAFAVLSFSVLLASCNKNEIFERELYKKVIAVISSDDYNILNDTQDMNESEIKSYVSASCGGTDPVEEDVAVSMIQDNSPFEDYNWAMYDADVSKYAKLLPTDKYRIDDYHIVIPKGEKYGKMLIRFYPEGLSPDSAYFLPLSIASASAYEINPKKSNILYRVLIKNAYAEQLPAGYTTYIMRGYRSNASYQMNKEIQPLTRNKVRMMAGNLKFEAAVNVFEQNAVVLEVKEDNSVLITPYGSLEVQQVDGDPEFPNRFRLEIDDWGRKYKVFLLRYNYRDGIELIQMKEELRLEYTE